MSWPFNAARTSQLVEVDVSRVTSRATATLVLGNGGIENGRQGKIDVLAIIGPGVAFEPHSLRGKEFSEAVLCEIGFRKTRPYHAGYSFPKRRKWFSLTDEQYLSVAPEIFAYLEAETNARVAEWRTGGPENPWFVRRSPQIYVSHRRKVGYNHMGPRPVPRGIRFSVSRSDTQLVSDIFWAELNLNRQVSGNKNFGVHNYHPGRAGYRSARLNGLANYVKKRLKFIRGTKSRRVMKLKGMQDVRRSMESHTLMHYQLIEMLRRHFKPNYEFYPELLKIAKWDGKTLPWELEAMERTLPGVRERLKGIQLRIVREYEDCIVFEIFPSSFPERSSEGESEDRL